MAITALLAPDDDVNNTFVIAIDDTSPTIVYSPFADTFAAPSLTTGWNSYFSISGFANNSSVGVQGEGSTFHVTSADGASLDIRWNGKSCVRLTRVSGASCEDAHYVHLISATG
jgi:hypothetical protein